MDSPLPRQAHVRFASSIRNGWRISNCAWKAYYAKKRVRLFALLVTMLHERRDLHSALANSGVE